MRVVLIALLFGGCGQESEPSSPPSEPSDAGVVIERVTATGEAGAYDFAVTLRSPDTGCDQYANWWEVLDADGALLYRRILGHSHVDEQPFTRSGGPVNVGPDDAVFVRAHMHPQGYGDRVFGGTAGDGFARVEEPPAFDAEIESTDPLPTGCAH